MELVSRKYLGEKDGKHVFQRGNEIFTKNWRPASHQRPMTPGQIASEMRAFER